MRDAILEAFAADRGDNALTSDLHDVLHFAEQFGKAELERTKSKGWSVERHRAMDLVLWAHEVREWLAGSPSQKMPAAYYLLRAINLGAALVDAGVFYAKGSGGGRKAEIDDEPHLVRLHHLITGEKMKPEAAYAQVAKEVKALPPCPENAATENSVRDRLKATYGKRKKAGLPPFKSQD